MKLATPPRLVVVLILVVALLGALACRSSQADLKPVTPKVPPPGSSPEASGRPPETVTPEPPVQPASPAPTVEPEAEAPLDVENGEGLEDGATGDWQSAQTEALELCQSAGEFLDQGDLESALSAVDRAYELMLALPNNGDETYSQAKEDIRRLVADLIVRSYGSPRSAARPSTTSWDLAMQLVNNEHVQREVKSLTTVERAEFLEGYRRSGQYRPMILAKLEQAGLPSQLSWLPLVESWFKVRALSRASALGLWQFIASTGQRYGLKRDGWVDGRLDPEKSTDAAIGYLTELHRLFGDWPKALAAYNCGEIRVQRLQGRSQDQYLDFWDLYALLPGETRRYVPRLFAALLILENPASFGITLPEPDRPGENLARVRVERSVSLEALDASLGLVKGTLASLNPELRYGATPQEAYELAVPADRQQTLLDNVARLPEWKRPTPEYVTHRVRSGETLSTIARRYGSSVTAIRQFSGLRSAHRIYPGQRLRIPIRRSLQAAAAATYDPVQGTHTVRSGESLYTIARRYHTTVERLQSDNGLSSTTLQEGQTLKVRPGSQAGLRRYQVVSGDTLGGIAAAQQVSLAALLRANGLTQRSTLRPGQWLAIPE